MLSEQEQTRYSKQIIMPEVGPEGQQRLRAAKVLVIGAGGLGCPVLQYLTAAGVGEIGIADGDVIDISNLQRQVLYTEGEIGQGKAATAQKKLELLNPNVRINVHPFFIDSSNALDLIGGYDIIVDGSDNFATRYLVNDASVLLDKPMVSGAIYKFEGQVSVFNYKGGPTYRCIFPEPPGADESPNCAEIGVIAALPGIIGSIQANEVIKMIIGIGDVLSGRLLVIDTLTMHMHTFQFDLINANKQITQLPALSLNCEVTVRQIDYEQLQEMLVDTSGIQLVDVREPGEHEAGNIGGANIPLSTINSSYHLLDPQNTIVLYCASGTRSARFGKLLLDHGFKKVVSLKNGIKPHFVAQTSLPHS
jgi:adenylyltransferase/sulfurtransferase